MASALQKEVLKYLKSLEYCWVIKVISANERGCPDILCCYKGRFVAIEVKEKGDRISAIQSAQICRISKAKGNFVVARSLYEVEHLIAAVDKI